VSRFAIQYRKEPSEHGTWVLEETGWCLDSDAAGIEAGCTKRYKLVAIPNAAGAVMKVLDGTNPALVAVRPTTYALTYLCVKVLGQVEPLAPSHSGGLANDHAVLSYRIRYQQVGGVN
jgi:hypothetical protein